MFLEKNLVSYLVEHLLYIYSTSYLSGAIVAVIVSPLMSWVRILIRARCTTLC